MLEAIGKFLFLYKLKSTCTGYYQKAQAVGTNFNRNVQILRMDPKDVNPKEREKAAQEVQKALFYASGAVASAFVLSYIAVKVSAAASAIATFIVCYSSRSNRTIEGLLTEINRLRQGKSDAEEKITLLQNRINELLEQVRDENLTSTELNKKIENLQLTNEKISDLNKSQLEKEEIIKKQQEEITLQNKKIEDLKKQINTRDETINGMTETIKDLKSRIDKLEAELALLQNQLKKQEDNLNIMLRLHSVAKHTLPVPATSARQIEHNLQERGTSSSTPTPAEPCRKSLVIEQLLIKNQELQKMIEQLQINEKTYKDKMTQLKFDIGYLTQSTSFLTDKLSKYESQRSRI